MKINQKIVIALYLFSLFLTAFVPDQAFAGSATISIAPSTTNCKVGATVTVAVLVDSGGQSINAAEGTIVYSSDVLEYQSLSTSGTVFELWTKPPSGGSTSTSFGGGLSGGYNGSGGKILSITFKAKHEGSATFSVSGGKVLANDGNGTNVYGGGGSAAITVSASTSPPTIKSASHPDQNAWYNNKNVELSWSGGTGATGYIFSFNQSSSTDPTSSVSNLTKKTFENVADGVWYFHLKAKTATGFLPVVHYAVRIDSTSPPEFITTVDQEGRVENPRPKVLFSATDDLSGIKEYTARIDDGDPFIIKSGDNLPKQRLGNHKIVIKAIDNAGNIRESVATFFIQGIDAPLIKVKNGLVGLLDPICFEGYSEADDTISVFVNNKKDEDIIFLVKDARLKNTTKIDGLPDAPKGQVAMGFCYKKLLLPGEYNFNFIRTNKDGAESGFSKSLKVVVDAATIKILGLIIPMKYVIFALIILIILLILLIIYLARKLHLRVKNSFNRIRSSAKNIFSNTRHLKDVINKTIPDHSLSKKEVEEIKTELKEEIDQTEKER